jgi:hypothetical protein
MLVLLNDLPSFFDCTPATQDFETGASSSFEDLTDARAQGVDLTRSVFVELRASALERKLSNGTWDPGFTMEPEPPGDIVS